MPRPCSPLRSLPFVALVVAVLVASHGVGPRSRAAAEMAQRSSSSASPTTAPAGDEPPARGDPCQDVPESSDDRPDSAPSPNVTHVVYAIPKDGADRYRTVEPLIRAQVLHQEALVARRSKGANQIPMDWLDPQAFPDRCLDISTIHLPTSKADIHTYMEVETALRFWGGYDKRKHYLVFVDGWDGFGKAGMTDTTTGVAVVDLERDPVDAPIPLHEQVHGLGGVKPGVPGYDYGDYLHVNDDPLDLMAGTPSTKASWDGVNIDLESRNYWMHGAMGVLDEPHVQTFTTPDTSAPELLDRAPDALRFTTAIPTDVSPSYRLTFPAAWDDRGTMSYRMTLTQRTIGDAGDPLAPPVQVERARVDARGRSLGGTVEPDLPELTGPIAFDAAGAAGAGVGHRGVVSGAGYSLEVTPVDASGNVGAPMTYSFDVPSAVPTSITYRPIVGTAGTSIRAAIPAFGGVPVIGTYRYEWKRQDTVAEHDCKVRRPDGPVFDCPVPPEVKIDTLTGAITGPIPDTPPTDYAIDVLVGLRRIAVAHVVIGDPAPPQAPTRFGYDRRVLGTTDSYTATWTVSTTDTVDITPVNAPSITGHPQYQIVDGTLPVGATLDPNTGVIHIVAPPVGTTTATVGVRDDVRWWYDREAPVTIEVR